MELSNYALLIAVAATAAVAISFHTRRPFPRVGNQTPFGIGYLITAFKATTKGQELIEEGLSKYPGKPFVLPTLGGSLLFTANKADVELMKKSDDSMVRPGTVSCFAPRSAYPLRSVEPTYRNKRGLPYCEACEMLLLRCSLLQGLQLDYVMNKFQQRTPYQAAVVQSEVTRAIGKFIPDVVEETQLSTEETFSPNGHGAQCHSFVTFANTPQR